MGLSLATGLIAAMAVNRVFESQLVGVSPSDPVVIVAAPAILVTAALGRAASLFAGHQALIRP